MYETSDIFLQQLLVSSIDKYRKYSKYRIAVTDYIQRYRYNVYVLPTILENDTTDLLQNYAIQYLVTEGGFQNATLPSISFETQDIETIVYDDHNFYNSEVTYGDITLSKGLYITGGYFYEWIKAWEHGKDAYRLDFALVERVRGGFLSEQIRQLPFSDMLKFDSYFPYNIYYVISGIPTGEYKEGNDFDAGSSDISIEVINIKYKRFIKINYIEWLTGLNINIINNIMSAIKNFT